MVSSALKDNNADISFALIYLLENNDSDKKKTARLVATTFDENLAMKKGDDGIEELSFINGHSERNLPNFLLKTQEFDEIDNDTSNGGDVMMTDNQYEPINASTEISTWPLQEVISRNSHVIVKLKDDSQAVLLPVTTSFAGETDQTAILICGLNPRKAIDKDYVEFLRVIKKKSCDDYLMPSYINMNT